MKLTLPLPPPANHYKKLRVVRGIPQWFLTSRAKKFYAQVKQLGMGQVPLAEPVILTLRIYRARRVGDWDGFTKCVCDALQGIAYHNDSQISEAHVYRRDDKANPRVEVDVRPMGAEFEPFPAAFRKPAPAPKPKPRHYGELPLFDASDFERPPPKLTLAERAVPNYRPPSDPKGK